MSKPTNAAIVDLNGRKWNPFETASATTGFVTFTEGEGNIHVPYGTDPISTTVQAHELAHVRYSAKIWTNLATALKRLTAKAGTNPRIIGYAEDMRITALAGRLRIKTLPAFGDKLDEPIIESWVQSFVKVGVPEARVRKAVDFILNQHTTVLKTLDLQLNTLQQKANAERYIIHCAQHIHALLAKDEKPDSTPEPTPSKDKGKAGKPEKAEKDKKADPQPADSDDSEQGDPADGDDEQDGDGDSEADAEGDSSEGDTPTDSDSDEGRTAEADPSTGGSSDTGVEPELDLTDLALPDVRDALVASIPAPPDVEKLVQTFQHTLDTVNWMPVPSIERVPLVRRAAQSRNKGRKLSETGVALGSAYDAVAPNERRPFTAKRRGGVGGLTVLIDCSGSMCISNEQLEQLLVKYPQGVVVTYSGGTGDDYHNTGGEAVVRIIASHGRLAAADNFRDVTAGMNGCDGPVLEWLAKQSGERVWVCDGCISGKRDQMVAYDTEARDAWLKAHRITQHHNLTEYLESLT